MSEHVCICCVFLNGVPSRHLAIERLFEADPSWMGQPSSYMVLDPNGNTSEASWPAAEIEQPLNGKLLFIYSKQMVGGHPFRSCLSVDEGNDCAVYTMSFPLNVLKMSRIEEAEKRLMHIYEVAKSIEVCVLTSGPELEAKPTKSADEAISAATATDSLAVWVIADAKNLSGKVSSFEAVKLQDGVSLLRHPSCLLFDRK